MSEKDGLSWSHGPPKSDVESWHWNRRSELLQIATQIAMSMCAGRTRVEAWEQHTQQEVVKIADEAFLIAARIAQLCEAREPRFG